MADEPTPSPTGQAKPPAAPQPKSDEPEKKSEGEAPSKVLSVEAELDATTERIRGTAKWLVGTFGAIAGALVVGVKLTDIGQLEGDDRTIAAVGAGLAIAAAILIVFIGSLILARGRVALSDLTRPSWRRNQLIEELERDPSLYAPYDSLKEFSDALSDKWAKESRAWLRVEEAEDPKDQVAPYKEYLAAKRVLAGLNKINLRLLAVARLFDLKIAYARASKAISVLALVAAIGAGAFFWVNNVPSDEESAVAVPQSPAIAVADLTASGEERLEETLGAGCDLDELEVVALAASEDEWEVVSLPVDGCETARFSLGDEEAVVQPIGPLELDLPTR